MRNTAKLKLKEAMENAESYIEQMKAMDDRKLSKHIDLFQQQIQMAYHNGNHEAYELLQEYERQAILSRMLLNFKD